MMKTLSEVKQHATKLSEITGRRAFVAIVQALKFEIEQDAAHIIMSDYGPLEPEYTVDTPKPWDVAGPTRFNIQYSYICGKDYDTLLEHPKCSATDSDVRVKIEHTLEFRGVEFKATAIVYCYHTKETRDLLRDCGKLHVSTFESLVC